MTAPFGHPPSSCRHPAPSLFQTCSTTVKLIKKRRKVGEKETFRRKKRKNTFSTRGKHLASLSFTIIAPSLSFSTNSEDMHKARKDSGYLITAVKEQGTHNRCYC